MKQSIMLGRLQALRGAISERSWDGVEFHYQNVAKGVTRLVQAWADGDTVDESIIEEVAWSPMAPAERLPLSEKNKAILLANGGNQALIDELDYAEIWKNELYTVTVTRHADGWVTELSIRRNDRRAAHDWRHFQRIKSEIAGPQIEAVEMYPAENRLMDTANQYYVFCLPPGTQFPFGYTGARNLADSDDMDGTDGARQRPLPPDWNSTWADRLQGLKNINEEAGT